MVIVISVMVFVQEIYLRGEATPHRPILRPTDDNGIGRMHSHEVPWRCPESTFGRGHSLSDFISNFGRDDECERDL
jgi:hypothetical protein